MVSARGPTPSTSSGQAVAELREFSEMGLYCSSGKRRCCREGSDGRGDFGGSIGTLTTPASCRGEPGASALKVSAEELPTVGDPCVSSRFKVKRMANRPMNRVRTDMAATSPAPRRTALIRAVQQYSPAWMWWFRFAILGRLVTPNPHNQLYDTDGWSACPR